LCAILGHHSLEARIGTKMIEHNNNLNVDSSFLDDLNSIEKSLDVDLSENLIKSAKEIKKMISEKTFVGYPSDEILRAYHENVSKEHRYNPVLFKKFENIVLE
jgi:hypothetical protein